MQRRRFVLGSTLTVLAAWSGVSALGQGPAANGPAPNRAASGVPDFVPLAAEHAKYLDDILKFWEHTTSKTERYRCVFNRWEYEPKLKTYSEGVIKYSAPDKGLFRVESTKILVPPTQPGGDPEWKLDDQGFREHWVCDGKSIFEFDHLNKQLKQRRLPPEMQGKQIAEGPLPFLFGAKRDQLHARFWMRVLKPKAPNEFWIEAWPKHRSDAANFKYLQVILAEQDFLPKGMVLFHRNDHQTTFEFKQRETNWSMLGHQLNPFLREFFEPQTPRGWRKVVEPLGGAPAATSATRQAPQIRPLLKRR